MAPVVSVLMPVYNAERYLREAVESVLAQTFTDFELIAVDDGSTDGSLSILREFERRDSRVRIISRPNTGYVVALNEMLGIARGKFIARMDADDVCEPERFRSQLSWFESVGDGAAVGGWVQIVDSDGDPLTVWRLPAKHDVIDKVHISGGELSIVHPAVMMRRDAIESVGRYRKEWESVEDFDLFLRLAEIGRIGNIPQVVLKYRVHRSSVSHTRAREQAEKFVRMLSEAQLRRGFNDHSNRKVPLPFGEVKVESFEEKWGWWAVGSGYPKSARKYAWRLVSRSPTNKRAWKLAVASIRATLSARGH